MQPHESYTIRVCSHCGGLIVDEYTYDGSIPTCYDCNHYERYAQKSTEIQVRPC
jgi:hypothetical protein